MATHVEGSRPGGAMARSSSKTAVVSSGKASGIFGRRMPLRLLPSENVPPSPARSTRPRAAEVAGQRPCATSSRSRPRTSSYASGCASVGLGGGMGACQRPSANSSSVATVCSWERIPGATSASACLSQMSRGNCSSRSRRPPSSPSSWKRPSAAAMCSWRTLRQARAAPSGSPPWSPKRGRSYATLVPPLCTRSRQLASKRPPFRRDQDANWQRRR
mmetsp:Transcript_44180/g.131911  ORF Transcript_44180/g.131911 Transcript_44180/m.131911 type:complete len:217 (-) Transcript_44180:399-1049(-)